MTTTTLFAVEHARGLHKLYAPAGCEECPTTERIEQRIIDVASAVMPPQHVEGFESLGQAIARLRNPTTGAFFGDGLPPEPEPEMAPDGNPWCELCRGARQLAVRHDRQPTVYRACPECAQAPWRIARQYDRLKLAIPPRFQTCRLETFPVDTPAQQGVLSRLCMWLEDPEPSWLYLHGPTGRGKTGLAVALLYALADRGLTPAFSIITDLLSTIKSTFGSAEAENESSILDVLYAADIFVLDDLGSEYHRGAEDWASEKIFQLIAGRHAALRRTIITSNLALPMLSRKLGHPRTTRRIEQATGPQWVIDMSPLPLIRTSSCGDAA